MGWEGSLVFVWGVFYNTGIANAKKKMKASVASELDSGRPQDRAEAGVLRVRLASARADLERVGRFL